MKKLFTILAILLISTIASAEPVCLQWDAATDPDLAGYNVYRNQTGTPFLPADFVAQVLCGAGDITCSTYTDDVSDGVWHWATTAFDSNNNECQDCSNIFTETIDTVAPGPIVNLRKCE